MVFAGLCVVAAWWYLQQQFYAPPAATTQSTSTSATSSETTTASTSAITSATTSITTAGDIRASDLPLTPAQRKLAESLGLDVAQIVVSEALIACVREKLGSSRYEQILAGATPSMLESAKLLACL